MYLHTHTHAHHIVYSYLLLVAIYSVDFFRKKLGTDNLHLCTRFFFLSSSIVPSPPRFFLLLFKRFLLVRIENLKYIIHLALFSLSLSLSVRLLLFSIDNRKLFSSYHHFSWDSDIPGRHHRLRERERDMYMFVWKENRYVVYIWNLTGRRIFSCPVGLTLASVEIRKRHWILRLIRKKWGRPTQQQKNEGRKKKGGPLDI
jgi:hypothetical protein